MSTQLATIQPKSVLLDMATRFGMEAVAFERIVRAICLPPDKNDREATKEEFAAFLLVAKEYNLNPLTKEIYGFRAKNGAMVPVVPVDGWTNIMNSNPAFDGIEFDDHLTGEKLTAITARIWRKDRSRPTAVKEYMAECARDTETWRKWPRRMLRHKALIQCARYAFSLSGIYDPDEAERMGADVSAMQDVTPPAAAAIGTMGTIPKRDAGPPAITKRNGNQKEVMQDRPALHGPDNAKPAPDVGRPTRAEPADDDLDIPASLRRVPKTTAPQAQAVAPPQIEAEPPVDDPEKMLKWIDAVLGEVSDPAKLEATWDFKIECYIPQMFPPDQEEAVGLYRKHERRLAP